jgi:hypothetical protein
VTAAENPYFKVARRHRLAAFRHLLEEVRQKLGAALIAKVGEELQPSSAEQAHLVSLL